jgi:NADPH-dependent glutamate synthase beta subunit-like oxidoreductase
MSLGSLRVAVVGSGPAGIYAAAALAERDVPVDVIDRLPTPFGLVRYGVAPDHEKMKSVTAVLQKVLEGDKVRFLGNVELGRDITVDDLHRHYHAVIVASGPAQAKFTTKELRELGELANADVLVHPGELQIDEAGEATLNKNPAARRNLDILRDWSQRTPADRPRRLHLRFLLRPVAISGQTAVTGIELARGRLDGTGRAVDTGERTHLPAQTVLRSVGYRGLPVPGLPFDEDRGIVPNSSGRVLRDGAPTAGEYVTGWIKRGPTGVIGTNKHDASETVRCLLEDAALLPRPKREILTRSWRCCADVVSKSSSGTAGRQSMHLRSAPAWHGTPGG